MRWEDLTMKKSILKLKKLLNWGWLTSIKILFNYFCFLYILTSFDKLTENNLWIDHTIYGTLFMKGTTKKKEINEIL
jgi:hypothetical protein